MLDARANTSASSKSAPQTQKHAGISSREEGSCRRPGCSEGSATLSCAVTFRCAPMAIRRGAVPGFSRLRNVDGPAPLRPYDGLPHVRWWRTFKEYGNGIGRRHVRALLDTARWMLKLGWPKRITSAGALHSERGQVEHLPTRKRRRSVRWFRCGLAHRTWGTRRTRIIRGRFFIYATQGNPQSEHDARGFHSLDKNEKTMHFDCVSKGTVPEDVAERYRVTLRRRRGCT